MIISKSTAFAVLLCGVGMAQADTIVNTFGPTGVGYFPSVGWNINSGSSLGKTFTISNTFNLTQIDVALRLAGESDQVLLSLRSDVGGQPGSALETFTLTNSFGGGTAGVFTANSILNPEMSAGTYHVTIETIGDAAGKWNLNNGAGTGPMVVSTDGGSSWTTFTDTNGAIRVFGTQPVPEPATMAVLGLGTLAIIRRRKK
jgi:hypothetical protein